MRRDERQGCGISWLWLTPPCDPMAPACLYHDRLYDGKNEFGLTRKQADKEFLQAMLFVAGLNKSRGQKARAYFYYGIARAAGWLWWNEGKT